MRQTVITVPDEETVQYSRVLLWWLACENATHSMPFGLLASGDFWPRVSRSGPSQGQKAQRHAFWSGPTFLVLTTPKSWELLYSVSAWTRAFGILPINTVFCLLCLNEPFRWCWHCDLASTTPHFSILIPSHALSIEQLGFRRANDHHIPSQPSPFSPTQSPNPLSSDRHPSQNRAAP